MTNDVYVFRSPSRPGWLKVGYSGDRDSRLRASRTWLEEGEFIACWPGGGRELEQWLHGELEQVHRRDGRTEWFRCDLKAVELAVSIGARNGIEFAARAVIARNVKDTERRIIAEKTAERQKELATREAGISYSREDTVEARKAAQPVFVPKLPPFPRVIERGK